MISKYFAGSVVALLALSSVAFADTPAVNFSGFSYVLYSNEAGFQFDVTAPVNVTALSVFDESGDGLNESHEVGLWDSTGTLLASVTVGAGTIAPLDSTGQFRYVTLGTPVSLATGVDYRVAALFSGTDGFAYSVGGLSTAPGISYVQDRFENPTNSLVYPTITQSNAFGPGYFGGSFLTGGGVAVPESGSFALMGMAAIPLLWMIRRRAVR